MVKVPTPAKIQELEARIAAVERRVGIGKTSWPSWTPEVEKEWHGLWERFDALFERMFGK